MKGTAVILTVLALAVVLLAGHGARASALRGGWRAHRAPGPAAPPGTIRWFTQTVDHGVRGSRQAASAVFEQRYLVNDTYASGDNSPVFLFLCGEAPMEEYYLETLTFHLARTHGARVFLLEHRYYGQSVPVPDMTPANMKYLSSEQAIADVVEFMAAMKQKYTGKWVVYGASYSACLSAWTRTLHPDLVVGAVAPSGPVIIHEDMPEYYEQFAIDASHLCGKAVFEASQLIVAKLQDDAGRAMLSKKFNACSPLTVRDAYFFAWSLYASPDDALDRLALVYRNLTGGECTDFNETAYVEGLSSTAKVQLDGGRQWFYQKCTEFGFFHTTTSGQSVFPPVITVEHNLQWCAAAFDHPGMKPDTDHTTSVYQKLFTSASQVLFTNGLQDPWHTLSINEDLPGGGVKAVTYDAGHCAPMHEPTPEDPPSLVSARQAVGDFVAGLLA